MRRAIAFSFLLACSGFLLGDSPARRSPSSESASLLAELVRLTNGGFSDETILAFAKAHRAELPSVVSTDDLLWLRKSGVSETVIRYMTAIDVRGSDETTAEDVAYDSGEAAGYPAGADSYGDSYSGTYPDSYARSYYAGFDPFYGDFGYPYPVYFFVDHSGFFGRFHRRGHRFEGRRGDLIDHRGSGRPRFPRGAADNGFRERRGRAVVGHAGPGRQASPRAGFAQGFRGPRTGVTGHGGFRQPASPRGAPAGVGRGPIARPAGGHGTMARPGGTGRR